MLELVRADRRRRSFLKYIRRLKADWNSHPSFDCDCFYYERAQRRFWDTPCPKSDPRRHDESPHERKLPIIEDEVRYRRPHNQRMSRERIASYMVRRVHRCYCGFLVRLFRRCRTCAVRYCPNHTHACKKE